MTDENGSPSGSSGGRKRSVWPLVIGLPLIAVVAAAAIFFTSGEQGSNEQRNAPPEEAAESGSAPPSETEDSEASGDSEVGTPALGDEDAPVVMQEFSDYQ